MEFPTAIPPSTRSSEIILCSEPVVCVQGESEESGVAILTPEELRFTAESGEAMAVVMDLSDVDDAEWMTFRRALVVTSGAKAVWFGGSRAKELWKQLDALLDLRSEVDTWGDAASDELVVAGGPMYLLLGVGLGAHGHVTLTDRRIRFEASTGLENVFFRNRCSDFDVYIEELTDFGLVGDNKLQVVHGETQHVFSGELASHLCGCLDRILVAEIQSDKIVLGEWPARMSMAIGSIPGRLVIDEDFVRFLPTHHDSSLKRELGTSQISEVRCTGWPDRKLVIMTEAGVLLVFKLGKAAERFETIVPCLSEPRREDVERMVQHQRDKRGLVQDLISQRDSPAAWEMSSVIKGVCPTIRWISDLHAERGWLAVNNGQLLYLPEQTNRKASVFAFPMVERIITGHDDSVELVFQYGGKTERFVPVTGERFVTIFWDAVEAENGPTRWEDRWGSRFRSLVGVVPSLEIAREGRLVAKLRPAKTVAHPEGFGIVFSGTLPEGLIQGARVVLAANTESGRYVFGGIVVRVPHTTQNGRVVAGEDEHSRLLVVAQAPELQLDNRRAHFRLEAPVGMAVQSATEWKQAHVLCCLLQNLSLGGCAFVSSTPFHRGADLRVELEAKDQALTVRAQVLATRRLQAHSKRWTHRVRFMGQTQRGTKMLENMVMDLQREQLSEGLN